MGTREVFKPGSPEVCARSSDNYPAVVMGDARITCGTDVSCQGSVTQDLLEPREEDSGTLPAQIDAVTPDTDLVTLSIGGNDLGFSDIARCVQAGADSPDCEDEMGELIRQRLEELPSRLDTVYAAIRENHGDSETELKIVATGYIPLVSGEDHCPVISNISTENRFWVAALTFSINTLLATSAERNGASFVLPPNLVAHSVCAPVSERFVDVTGKETNSYPIHPTPAGQAAMGQAVLGAV